MAEKFIRFDSVKSVAKENIRSVTLPMLRSGSVTLLAMKRFMDGTPPYTTRGTEDLLQKKLVAYVDAADVRCISEIVSLIPKGADNRIQGWLYGKVEASYKDDGWILRPAIAS